MSCLPGSSGYPVFGDKSVEFYRNPQQFISKKIAETGSKVFLTRLLNIPTVFICSQKESRELLHEKYHDFDHGYRDFLFNSYGDNILFENGESAAHLKSCMAPLFAHPENFQPLISRVCDDFLDTLPERHNPLNVYEEFKELMTKLCLELFLGYSDSNNNASKAISRLSTLHWHGIISLPVTLKIPFAGESGWSKAQQAKKELLIHIRQRIDKSQSNLSSNHSVEDNPSSEDSPSSIGMIAEMHRAPFRNPSTEIEQHLLLFVSALIPKAFASIVTSFVLELAGEDMEHTREHANTSSEYHDQVLTEVQRLWPPFLGGRRIANKDTTIGKYKIPKGHAVVYVSYYAHRDEKAFKQPEKFLPERWVENGHKTLFTFGAGPRACIGTCMIQHILKYTTKKLMEKYSWKVHSKADDCTYKLLPVARPEALPMIQFARK